MIALVFLIVGVLAFPVCFVGMVRYDRLVPSAASASRKGWSARASFYAEMDAKEMMDGVRKRDPKCLAFFQVVVAGATGLLCLLLSIWAFVLF